MEIENPYNISFVSGISSAPGRTYFSRNWVEGDGYASSVYSIDDVGVRRVTFGSSERKPLYHGGSLYYISRDGGVDRLMKLESMMEPVVIFRHKQILDYVPFKDGVLAVISENFKSKRPFVIRGLRYKHDSTGLLRKRRTLYFANGDRLIRVIPNSYDVAGVKSNGTRIIVSCAHMKDDLGLTDLYELDFDSGDLRRITKGQGSIDAFDLSEEGAIAFSGHRQGVSDWPIRKLYLPETKEVYEIGMTAGTFICTDIFDDSETQVKWDRNKVYVTGQVGGVTSVFEVHEGTVRRVTPDDISVRHFDILDGSLSYSYSATEVPSILVTPNGNHDPNHNFKGYGAARVIDAEVEGWIIFKGKENPSILFIHGGPHSAFGPVFTIEMQYFANRGYNILYCNERGSTGYGEEFVKGSIADWGGGDSEDILNFLHTAKNQFKLTGRIGIKGLSYGGYMVNWLVTQTNEFSAAVSEKGVSNLLSSVGTSDIGYWFDAPEEIGSTDPWSPKSIRKFMERSPISYVKNVSTPTLLIHGEDDHRCPIEQSEQFFTALKFYGVETVFVRLQGESHELSNRENPLNRMDSLIIKREWFDRYLREPEQSQKLSNAGKTTD